MKTKYKNKKAELMELKKALKKYSESDEAIALMSWAAHYPEIRNHIFAIENGGSRNKLEAIRLRKQGVTAGVSDYFYAYPSKGKHGFFIELKRPAIGHQKSGRATEAQLKFLEEKSKLGYETCIAKGWVEAANALIDYRSDLNMKKLDCVFLEA